MQTVTSLSLNDIMDLPLPNISIQKRLYYRPSINEIMHVYDMLNYHAFDGQLNRPVIQMVPRCRKYWGMCMGTVTKNPAQGSYCKIRIMDKWFCPQWMVTTLAHEMVHQHQWDIEGPIRESNGKDWLMSHGPSFFKFRNRLAEHYIPLKTAHSIRCWFQHQDMFKC